MKKLQFIFEMANNHMGDITHGLKIIDALRKFSVNYYNHLHDIISIHQD